MSTDIPGYAVLNSLQERRHTYLAEGTRIADGQRVLLKGGRGEHGSSEIADLLASEFDLIRSCEDGLALELVEAESGVVLVLDDQGARPLRSSLSGPLELVVFLSLARGITDAVARIHERGVAHLSLSPESILVGVDGPAALVHFASASAVGRQEQLLVPATAIAEDLRYLAPEQTGRLHASVDRRADLYSLGVVFYEMLTGAPPFEGDRPIELVHAHVARSHEPVRARRAGIPVALSAIVDHLLAKDAGERYQTAAGLLADLDALAADPHARLTPGLHDVTSGLGSSTRMVGREADLSRLVGAFARAEAGEPALALVAGSSGIGKSRLMQALEPELVERNARWAGGKFEELRRDIPYIGLAAALADLVRQVLMEDADEVALVRERLLEALAGNGALLVQLIPDLELLLGPQPEVPALPARAAEARFRLVVQRFVDAWGKIDRPLVLFLDDLQWADPASLDLMRGVLGGAETRVLVVGAYREAEVGPGHPLLAVKEAVAEAGVDIDEIVLGPLDPDAVAELLADTLDMDVASVAELATSLHAKSAGNPFFLRQLLEELTIEGILHQDPDRRWRWDVDELADWRVTDNVVELMADRLVRTVPDALEVLSWAACLGSEFDVEVLATALARDVPSVRREVRAAAREGFMQVRRGVRDERYRFLHDRVQEAVYSLIDPDERLSIHLRLGRVLRERAGEGQERELFAAVDQLNEGRSLIDDPAELEELRRLDLLAGRRAMAASAPHLAHRYLLVALELLGLTAERDWDGPAWDARYDEARDAATDAARAAWLAGAHDELERLVRTGIARARTPLDTVPLYDLLIQHHTNDSRHADALDVGRAALAQLGDDVPDHPSRASVVRSLVMLQTRLHGRGPDAIRALPPMTDELGRAKVLLMNSLMAPAYYADPDAMAIMIFRSCELALRHGNAPLSVFAWNNYGFVLCHILGKYEKGHAFGTMALEMSREQDSPETASALQFSFTAMIDHWRVPLRETYPGYERGFQLGAEAGDLTYAGLALQMKTLALMVGGEPIDEVRAAMADAMAWMQRQQQFQTHRMVELYDQTLVNLQGRGNDLLSLEGPEWDSAVRRPELEAVSDQTALAVADLCELLLAVVLGDAGTARERTDRAAAMMAHVEGTVWVPFFHLLAGLVDLWPDEAPRTASAKRHLAKLRRFEANAPDNQRHRVLVLEAELLRSRGRPAEALPRYAEAAESAERSGAFLFELGLIAERAARCATAVGGRRAAEGWYVQAQRAYARWGADAKVEQLGAAMTSGEERDGDGGGIDLEGVLEMSQAVASELRLDELLRRIMTIALEVGGARSGALLVDGDGGLVVQARADAEGRIDVLQAVPFEDADELPDAIIRYVARTAEPVILEDAAHKGRFVLDPHVRRSSARSVLCAPLLDQGRLIGVIYLENDLVAGAFRRERIETLSLLSSSATAALTNASLVANLEEANRASERFVPNGFLELVGRRRIVDVGLGDSAERELTILFSDIRDFTAISERLTPQRTFEFINEYLGRVVPIVERNHGVIDKYIGDAIMALFPPDPGTAIRAALEMLAELDALNDERSAAGLDRIEAGVGIHTGPLMLGTVGTASRMDGTVIGDAVNTCSRVEGLTKRYGARLLVTSDAWDRLDVLERPRARRVDRVRVKGKTLPVDLLQVLTPVEVGGIFTVDEFDAGMDAYLAGDFTAAAARLAEVLRRDPADVAAAILRERCTAFLADGAPPDWDGVTAHTFK